MGPRRGCLARYGRTNRMEWFDYPPALAGSLERGFAVVLRTIRGEELGEVLMVSRDASSALQGRADSEGDPGESRSRVLRIADEGDRERAGHAEAIRHSRFEECRHLLEDGRWPVELLDVEILLDGRTTVVDLLKSDDFDLTALRAQFRDWYDFEAILEPAAKENEAALFIPAEPSLAKSATAGGCGSGGCGCRPSIAPAPDPAASPADRSELIHA